MYHTNTKNTANGLFSPTKKDLDLELHPDKGPNAPNALAEFQALQSSFEILKDEKDRKKFDDLVRVKRDQQRLHSQRNASYHLQHNARQRAAMHAKKKAKGAATAFSVPKLDQEKVLIVSLNEDGEEHTERRLRDFFSGIGKVEEVLFKNRGSAGIVMPTKDAAVKVRESLSGDRSNLFRVSTYDAVRKKF